MIVFISKSEADDRVFRDMAGKNAQPIVRVPDIEAGREQIRKTHPQVVVCDEDLNGSRSWRDLLEEAHAPEFKLIVVSKCPTEALWAEVLNLGGFDLLALPFHRDEVQWVVSSALRHSWVLAGFTRVRERQTVTFVLPADACPSSGDLSTAHRDAMPGRSRQLWNPDCCIDADCRLGTKE